MIDKRETLTVLLEHGASFQDISADVADYLRDPVSIELSPAHTLYIGYYKPINAVYAEIETLSGTPNEFTVEVYKSGAWVAPAQRDETKGFSRSGFITWDKAGSELSSVDGSQMAWVRVTSSSGTGPISIKGLNIVFCDRATIQQEFYNIDDVIQPQDLIGKLVAAKNEIVDRLAQRGYLKYDGALTAQDITAFDLHDVYQVRQAAVYFTLAKIFFVASDNMEDHWWAKYEAYQSKAERSLSLYKLDVDENDNGVNDETIGTKRMANVRWSR